MKIEISFTVPASIDDSFAILTDVEQVAPCFPGATLKRVVDADTFEGEVTVRLGPVQVNFAGTLTILARDPQAYTAQVQAKGKDTRGRGAADATIDIQLTAVDATTRVDLVTDLSLAGAVAQYGRGAGIITRVAAALIDDFSTNLQAQLRGDQPGEIDASAVSGISVLSRAVAGSLKDKLKKS